LQDGLLNRGALGKLLRPVDRGSDVALRPLGTELPVQAHVVLGDRQGCQQIGRARWVIPNHLEKGVVESRAFGRPVGQGLNPGYRGGRIRLHPAGGDGGNGLVQRATGRLLCRQVGGSLRILVRVRAQCALDGLIPRIAGSETTLAQASAALMSLVPHAVAMEPMP
jgi:hypothetical protein